VRQTVVLFDNDSSRLTRDAQARLDQFIAANQGVPVTRALITGHADSTGPSAGNTPLSQARANTVARYLQSHGLKAQQVVARGFSSSQPVESNATDDGRSQNRRAEVTVETN
jgi:outer membrane protein OmpA-like peptidoglycan-associated protein